MIDFAILALRRAGGLVFLVLLAIIAALGWTITVFVMFDIISIYRWFNS